MGDGAVPDGWRKVTVGEIAEVVGGSTPSTRVPSYWGGDICWATPTDITGLKSRYISETATKITEEGLKSAGLRLLPPRSILVTSRATVGACAISTVPVSTNQGFASLVCKDGVEPEFLYYHISARQRELARLSAGSTFTELPRRGFRKLLLLLPPLPEQRKIAEILSAVDDAIEKTEAVIEQVRRVKQGLAQQLLTRGLPGRHTHYKQTEVGEVPACWEVVRLGECIARGPTNGIYRPLSEYGAGVPIVRIDDFESGEFLRLDGFKRLRLPDAEVARYKLEPREVLVNRVNSLPQLGKCALVPRLPEPTVYESNMMRLGLNEQRLLPEYLVLWLGSPSAVRQIQASAKRAVAQASIDQDDVKTLLMPCPPVVEQARSIETVGEVDGRLKHERATLGALRQAKQNLMHVLLTGQVRVSVRDDPAETEP